MLSGPCLAVAWWYHPGMTNPRTIEQMDAYHSERAAMDRRRDEANAFGIVWRRRERRERHADLDPVPE